ncbi:MAG: hypothetical protein JW798_06180, partial [Prolixibacteraceae bacterium]|nr:hypothetical protein [Prolixibacteraceae bacterium]
MNRQIRSFLLITFVVAFMFAANIACNTKEKTDRYSGSASCIDCHEDFYKLWSTSHHGLAMQPVTQNFIKNGISEQAEKICIENAFYLALLTDTGLFISEHKNDTNVVYQATWALGGKNIYYFLTPFEKGRLQTLPLAYNVSTGNWYNNPESVVRNFSHETFNLPDDEAISWKDPQYTFNTSCYNCHVSQLTNHYNIENNSYKTLWKEPGINCETCHGPAEEHVKTALKAEKKGIELKELKLVSTSGFTPAQHNASCGSCHAKMRT